MSTRPRSVFSSCALFSSTLRGFAASPLPRFTTLGFATDSALADDPEPQDALRYRSMSGCSIQ
jgi:hypothetical protein